MYDTIHELDHEQTVQLHALYQSEWWTKGRTLSDVEQMLKHTDYVFGLIEHSSNQLVGFARTLTDCVYKALILDVIVHPEFRERGLGRKLMETIRAHKELQAVQHFELYCLPELESFYKSWGFNAELGTLRFMRSETFVEPSAGADGLKPSAQP